MALRLSGKLNKKTISKIYSRLITKTVPPNLTKFDNVTKVKEQQLQQQQQEEKIQKIRTDVTAPSLGNNVNFRQAQPIASLHRTTSPDNPRLWAMPFETEREFLYRTHAKKLLQPASLQMLIERKISDNVLMETLQESELHKMNTTMENSASQKILEKFKKDLIESGKMNKFPKMNSNPFPEPVKAAMSPYTVSDAEKAEQMLNEQKFNNVITFPNDNNKNKASSSSKADNDAMKGSKKFYGTSSVNCNSILRDYGRIFYGRKSTSMKPGERLGFFCGYKTDAFTNGTNDLLRRNDAIGTTITDAKRSLLGKKGPSEGSQQCGEKKKCPVQEGKYKKIPKMRLKDCPPPRCNPICKPKSLKVKCTKIEAPYPSFSESCYMEPNDRKTECEICPWTKKTNPNFKKGLKIPTRNYHTEKNLFTEFSKVFSNRKKYQQDRPLKPDQISSYGYCVRKPSLLSNYLSGNENLLRNFRNGDELEDYGIKKSTLSYLLCSKQTVDDSCEKAPKVTDYPKDCDGKWKDTSKICPTGLTYKKTRKDRLKKRPPKTNKC